MSANRKLRKIAWVLTAAMLLTMVPTFSFATDTVENETGTNAGSSSTLKQITEKYVDAQDGTEIANASAYSVAYEEKNPQKIKGYNYVDYSETVEQVYSHKDIPYIIGYPDGSVRTGRNLSRAEAATIFYRLYDGKYPQFTKRMSNNTFSDVKSNNWFYKEVETLYNIGILEGDGGRFRPNAPITRAELAVIAARFTDLQYASGQMFTDVPRGHWAYSYIVAATQKGWLKGYGDGTFKPDNNISRIETMTLINRVVNRTVTMDKLKELGVRNPYNDLVETFWGYCDVMEATIRHNGADWHGIEYNDGSYDVIVERFVDTHGNEIAKSVASKGKAEKDAKEIPAFDHLGYIRTITYVYSGGTAAPSIEKKADKTESFVGDTITYTISLSNGEKASTAWKNVVVTDKVPADLKFVDGSVYLNSKTADYTFRDGELTVNVGDIEIGQSSLITFKATVLDGAYGKTIVNEAIARGDNGTVKDDTYSATDPGVYINKGETMPYAIKTSNTGTAQVGDRVVYTVKMGNHADAEYKVEEAVMTDVIPAEVDLISGSVQVNGETGKYSYDDASRTLTVKLGDIEPGTENTVKFAVTVNKDGYGKTVRNIAVLSGKNITPVEAEDEIGVKVGDGNTRPYIEKTADKSSAKVGDRVTYTIKAGNNELSTVAIENAVVEDELPEGLDFVHGSVYVNGKNTNEYTFDEKSGKLSVPVGNIKPGKEVEIAFSVTINDKSYGKTIKNTAVLKGDNADPTEDTDEGVKVGDGAAELTVTKTSDKETAKVGDRITYTISASNSKLAQVSVKGAKLVDVIPSGLDFQTGSVQINGQPTNDYVYSEDTKELSVEMGDIEAGQTVNVTFIAVVNKDAYNKTVKNIANVTSDNCDPKQAQTTTDVEDGMADLTVTKTSGKTEAKVGDTIVYTIKAANSVGADVDVRDAVLYDTFPEELSFTGNVQLDGSGKIYNYDPENRELCITLGNIAPGQTKEIKISAVVNSGAYGKEVKNTAVVKSDNQPDKEGTSEITTIDPGNAYGHAGVKSVNKTKAKVGETVTYSITLTNEAYATADWEGATVIDAIPEGMSFAANVHANGQATTNYSYDSASKTLTLMPDALAPGESVTFTFDVTIDKGTEGQTLLNVAALDAGDGSKEPIPSDPVIVDPGFAQPAVVKTADKETAKAGDVVTYTVQVSNGNTATASWNNVYLRDTLPSGMRLVNTVFVNGTAVVWDYHNDDIEVQLGDIDPGQTVEVSYEAMVTTSAAGTLKNVALARGENGQATDSTTVQAMGRTPGEYPAQGYVEKTGNKTTVDLTSGDTNVTYTVKVGNEALASVNWDNVVFSDFIDSNSVSLVTDSVKLDGKKISKGSGYYLRSVGRSQNLVIDLGSIAPGEEHEIQFTFNILGNASSYDDYENIAVAEGTYTDPDDGKTYPLSAEGKYSVSLYGTPVASGIHLQLFQGTQEAEDGPIMFWPSASPKYRAINTHDACRTVYRSMTEKARRELLQAAGGQAALDRLSDEAQAMDKEIQFFIALGAAQDYEFNRKDPRNVEGEDYLSYTWTWKSGSTSSIYSMPATRNFLGRILTAVGLDPAGKTGYSYSSNDKTNVTSRLQWAEELCDIFGRDKNPDTNGLPVRQYTDLQGLSVKQLGIINEVSNWHTYTMDSEGHETWEICDGSTLN